MIKDKHIIFGGLGFIGQNLTQTLLKNGDRVLIVDRDHWGIDLVFDEFAKTDNCQILRANINTEEELVEESIKTFLYDNHPALVWHLAANSDISAGIEKLEIDLADTFLTTVSILKFCKKFKLQTLYFASSSAVYGDVDIPNGGFNESSATQPISNYGAMKLASEAILRSASQDFIKKCSIFRFPNVIGYPATHGVILDFLRKLKNSSNELIVLGNGKQNKPYLHVSDLINAMLHVDATYKFASNIEVFNLASPHENVYVSQIAREVCRVVSPNAKITYGTNAFGWVGDMPEVEFNVEKLMSTGWRCELSGIDAVRMTIRQNLEA